MGINIPTKEELIANKPEFEHLAEYLGRYYSFYKSYIYSFINRKSKAYQS